MSQKAYAVLITVLSAAFIGAAIFLIMNTDTQGPHIKFPQEEKLWWEDMEDKLLLQGVTASDNVDGDVTSSLIIEKIVKNKSQNAAMVTYVAQDTKHNITKTTKTWKIATTISGVSTEEKKPEAEVTNKINADEAGMSQANVQADENDIAEEPIVADVEEPVAQPVVEQAENQAPSLQLGANEATIQRGGGFDATSMVGAVNDDSDTQETLKSNIKIEGSYDANAVGDYQITYYVVDSLGKSSEKKTFTLHVTE